MEWLSADNGPALLVLFILALFAVAGVVRGLLGDEA